MNWLNFFDREINSCLIIISLLSRVRITSFSDINSEIYTFLFFIVLNFRTCKQTPFCGCRYVIFCLKNTCCSCFLLYNTGSIRDDPYWTSRKNSLELIELSSINKVSLV